MQSQKVPISNTREFDIDDYIGMESCGDLKENHTAADMAPPPPQVKRDGKMSWGMGRKEREYPPAIPLLVRTGNLASHMPWVLKRHYTDDGRLILTEEKVRHHEYFRAHRSEGRLMLELVALEDGGDLSDESNVEVDGGGMESGEDQEDEDFHDEKGGENEMLEVWECEVGQRSNAYVRSGSACACACACSSVRCAVETRN